MSVLTIETRGDLTENFHSGCIAVVSEKGLVASAGNWQEPCFYRSSSKPIQALPVLLLGLDKLYGLSDMECAMLAGSIAGEQHHTDLILSLMEKTGITEDDLIMLPKYPDHPATANRLIREGAAPRKIYHGCTPKHIALMLVQRYLTGSVKNYHRIESAAQRMVRYTISLFTDTPYADIKIGVDGCGVPVFGVPGDKIALSYLRLADPSLIPEAGFAAAAKRMTELMHRYPKYLRGDEYICSLLNYDENIVAKGGAASVYAFALKKEKLGFMFKLYDGNETSWQIIIKELLRQFAPETCAEMIEKLESTDLIGFTRQYIRCATGEIIGEMKPVFKLDLHNPALTI